MSARVRTLGQVAADVDTVEVLLPGRDPFFRLTAVTMAGFVAGFVDLLPDARNKHGEAGVRGLFVVDSLRRQGIGSLLMTTAAILASEQGCSSIGLAIDAPATSAKLVAWYVSIGYRVIDRRKGVFVMGRLI